MTGAIPASGLAAPRTSHLAWSLPYMLRFPMDVAAVFAVIVARAAVTLLKPLPTVLMVDVAFRGRKAPAWIQPLLEATGADRPEVLVLVVVVATILLFVIDWALTALDKFVNVTLGQKITFEVAADLLRHLQKLSLRFHYRRPTGDTIRRVTADCSAVATILCGALIPVAASVITLGSMLILLWRMDPRMAMVALAVAPYMALVLGYYKDRMADASYEEHEADGRSYEVVEQTFSAMPAVQAFRREKLNEDLFAIAGRSSVRAAMRAVAVQLRFNLFVGLGPAVGTVLVYWLGASSVGRGEITVGGLILFLSYLTALYSPIQDLMYTGSTIQGAAGSARRVLEVLHTEPEVLDRADAEVLGRARGDVRFEDVTFGYEPGRPVLRGVSLDVRAGQTVALVGPTGAGKSTLISLIPRFFDPVEGRVLVDGRDIRGLKLSSLREQVALVLQEPFLFPLSIAENIAYGRPGASRAQIEQAARAGRAHDFIMRLPEGYDSVIGERGATLSGGERQRLSIARALLKDAPILILDEPTSALDAGTEALIMEALETLMKGRTTFIIAHRLATVQHADRIIVLNDGAIEETGTHQDLIKSGGLYANYAVKQFLQEKP